MSDGYTDHEGRPISGLPYSAMSDEHERRMARVTLEAVGNTLWQNGGNYTRRQVAECQSDMAERIAHRWNTWSDLLERLESCARLMTAHFDRWEKFDQALREEAERAIAAIARAKP